MTLQQLQKEVAQWADKNFPDSKSYHPLLGVGEETGELMHAHLKGEQSIRHSAAKIHNMKIDSIGDIIIYLADYCGRNCISLEEAVEKTWEQVKQRDWQKNKVTGVEPTKT